MLNKEVSYDDTRDVSIRVIDKLMEMGYLICNEDSYFDIQDAIHDEINGLLHLDIDDNFTINIIQK